MTEHVSTERLADYLAGLLEESESSELEVHLFSCQPCATGSERLFGLAAAVHGAVPPVLSVERFGELEREGRIAAVNPMSPGEVAEVRYPPAGKLLVHRLGGFDLSGARRVDVTLLDLEGEALARFDDVPYDAARREVLIACQRHFVDLFPQDAVFRVEAVIGEKREEASYKVLHRV